MEEGDGCLTGSSLSRLRVEVVMPGSKFCQVIVMAGLEGRDGPLGRPWIAARPAAEARALVAVAPYLKTSTNSHTHSPANFRACSNIVTSSCTRGSLA